MSYQELCVEYVNTRAIRLDLPGCELREAPDPEVGFSGSAPCLHQYSDTAPEDYCEPCLVRQRLSADLNNLWKRIRRARKSQVDSMALKMMGKAKGNA